MIVRNPGEFRGAARDPAQVHVVHGKQVLLLHQLIEDLLADGVVALLPLREVLVDETAILRERGDTVLAGGEQPLAQPAIRHALGERGQFVLQYDREAVDVIVGQLHPPRDVLIEVGLGIAEARLQQFDVVDQFGRPRVHGPGVGDDLESDVPVIEVERRILAPALHALAFDDPRLEPAL